LPEDLEGLIAVNLPSYAGGCNLWGETEDPRVCNALYNTPFYFIT